jgi:hypothetical protein
MRRTINSILFLMICAAVGFAQDTTGIGNSIRGGGGEVRTERDGSLALQPRAARPIVLYSTCAGAPLSLPNRANLCYDGASSTLRLSANGGIYLNITTPSAGAGSVQSVGLAVSGNLFDILNSPVTTVGTLTANLRTQPINTFFAGGVSGAASAPTFRALNPLDIPAINLSNSNVNGGITGTLGNGFGGTGLSSYDFGDLVYANGAGALTRLAGNTTSTRKFLAQTGGGSFSGVPAWGVLAGSDVPPINLSNSNVNGGITGTLGTGFGGTGLSTLGTNNSVLGVNGTGSGHEYKTFIEGANISIVHNPNSITISTVNSSVSPLWNNLAPPTANLALTMSAFTSRWNYSNNIFRYWDGNGRLGINTTTPTASEHIVGGGIRVQAVATPAAPTVENNTTGATSVTYGIVANDVSGNKTLIAATTTTTSNATLNNSINWTRPAGAVSVDVIRTTGGASQGSISLANTGGSFTDTATVASAYAIPTRNASGDANIDGNANIGGTINGATISSTGVNGTTLNGTTINGATINNGAISGTTLSTSGNATVGGTINGATISSTGVNGTTLNGTTINGATINNGAISGTTLSTSGNATVGGTINGATINNGAISGSTLTTNSYVNIGGVVLAINGQLTVGGVGVATTLAHQDLTNVGFNSNNTTTTTLLVGTNNNAQYRASWEYESTASGNASVTPSLNFTSRAGTAHSVNLSGALATTAGTYAQGTFVFSSNGLGVSSTIAYVGTNGNFNYSLSIERIY